MISAPEISWIQKTILKDLLVDGRKNCTQIAKEIGVSKDVVYKNYQDLEQVGIIVGATTHINYRSLGYKAVSNLLINVNPLQADELVAHVKKMQDVYGVHRHGPGDVRVVATLKTLRQLDEIKDNIKQHFQILSMKTVIWTDVREMHENLTISSMKTPKKIEELDSKLKKQKNEAIHKECIKLDEIDLRLADFLATNGRASLNEIAQKMGISINAGSKRYQKLKNNGVIKITIQINPKKIGYKALAVFYTVFTLQADSASIIEKISRIPDVISIMKTTGDYDLQVYAMIKDLDQFLAIQADFSKIQDIAKMDVDISGMLDLWPTPKQYISTF